jgi:HSP20 family protein
MTITGFDPYSTLDRVLGRMSTDPGRMNQPVSIPIDVYRKGDEFIIELDVPGIDPSTIDIDVERNILTVAGEVHPRHEEVDEVLVCERPHLRFRRQLYLGDNLDSENITASCELGVLTLRIPVAERQRARKVEITTEGSREAIDVGGDSPETQSS